MKVYADNAATTKPDPAVVKAMHQALENNWGNPSSLHFEGEAAANSLEKARETIARQIKAKPEEIFFTSGGTESNNLIFNNRKSPIFISKFEHSSILGIAKNLKQKVSFIPVNSNGIINLENIKFRKNAFVSVMLVNNEVGTIQPIRELIDLTKDKKGLFHSDAVQALMKLKLNSKKLNFDSLSLSAHKIHGPKGVGALFIREGTPITPVFQGGGQEKGIRSGTQNIPGILGFAAAVKAWKPQDSSNIQKIRLFAEKLLKQKISCSIHGDNVKRAPHITNIHLPNCLGEQLVQHASLQGIAFSTGSACKEGKKMPSHVLLSMNVSKKEANQSIRLSWSRYNSKTQVQKLVSVLSGLSKALSQIT